jgi:2-dehydro-3-deoxyphosphooctonate aldolase (KDO 8-P synthase)
LEILAEVKKETGVPILTDVHEREQVALVSEVADVLQIPAFLCRQTDFVVAVAQSGKVVNVKKGQFLAPWDIGNIVDKILSANNDQILLTERGVSFGYNNLI